MRAVLLVVVRYSFIAVCMVEDPEYAFARNKSRRNCWLPLPIADYYLHLQLESCLPSLDDTGAVMLNSTCHSGPDP